MLMHNKMIFVRRIEDSKDEPGKKIVSGFAYVGSANLSESAWYVIPDKTYQSKAKPGLTDSFYNSLGADSSKTVAPKSSKSLVGTGSVALSFLLVLPQLLEVRHHLPLVRSRSRRSSSRARAKGRARKPLCLPLPLRKMTSYRGKFLRGTYRFQ